MCGLFLMDPILHGGSQFPKLALLLVYANALASWSNPIHIHLYRSHLSWKHCLNIEHAMLSILNMPRYDVSRKTYRNICPPCVSLVTNFSFILSQVFISQLSSKSESKSKHILLQCFPTWFCLLEQSLTSPCHDALAKPKVGRCRNIPFERQSVIPYLCKDRSNGSR